MHTPSFLRRALLAILLMLPALSSFAGAPADGYAVRQRWTLDGAGSWDYLAVDPVRQRLFVTRGDRVEVRELDGGKLLGTIGATAGVHGVAFAQDLGLGFTSNGKSSSVTVFDLDTLRTRAEVRIAGENPDAILYEAGSRKLYTFNGRSADASVFDAATMKPLATIALGGRPEFSASDGRRIYVNIEDKAELAVIDIASDAVVARWPLAGCVEPTGLALDLAHASAFSVCKNGVMVVTDTASGHPVARVAIGTRADAVIYDAASATVFSSGGDGVLSAVRQVDGHFYAPALSVETARGAKTMAMDHAGQRIYLPALVNRSMTVLVVKPDGV